MNIMPFLNGKYHKCNACKGIKQQMNIARVMFVYGNDFYALFSVNAGGSIISKFFPTPFLRQGSPSLLNSLRHWPGGESFFFLV